MDFSKTINYRNFPLEFSSIFIIIILQMNGNRKCRKILFISGLIFIVLSQAVIAAPTSGKNRF
jgi:hypothetical protein